VIAVVLHVIAIAALGIIYVKTERGQKDEPPVSIEVGKHKEEVKEEIAAPQEMLDRNEIPKPRTDVEAEMVSTDVPDLLSDQAPDEKVDWSKEAGVDSESIQGAPSGGTAIGVGGVGHAGSGRPSAFVGRTAGKGTGEPGGRKTGPTIKTEAAVRSGLIWLCRHQQKDGSWSASRMKDVCDAKGGCFDISKEATFSPEYDEGLTSLALLAFLGAGHDHLSKIKVGDTLRAKPYYFGEVVKSGLKWLDDRQKTHKDGRFTDAGNTYNESLATLAMCEAYGLSGQKRWRESAEKGVKFLLESQRRDPHDPSDKALWGWRYDPRAAYDTEEAKKTYPDPRDLRQAAHESDISATTWAVMALKDAEIVGIEVPREAMEGAMNFCKWVTTKERGVAYMDPKDAGRKVTGPGSEYDFHQGTLAALGMCVRTFVEHDGTDPVLAQSAAFIVKDLPTVSKNKLSVDYYYWYYASLALNQFDAPGSPTATGKFWRAWNEALQDAILPLQDDSKTCANGGWMLPDRWSLTGGPIYRTAMNVLTLEVYYRYANAFLSQSPLRKAEKPEKGRDERGREDEKKPEEQKPK
jgi:hypothetical protein